MAATASQNLLICMLMKPGELSSSRLTGAPGSPASPDRPGRGRRREERRSSRGSSAFSASLPPLHRPQAAPPSLLGSGLGEKWLGQSLAQQPWAVDRSDHQEVRPGLPKLCHP